VKLYRQIDRQTAIQTDSLYRQTTVIQTVYTDRQSIQTDSLYRQTVYTDRLQLYRQTVYTDRLQLYRQTDSYTDRQTDVWVIQTDRQTCG
jgi:hypothetical protein